MATSKGAKGTKSNKVVAKAKKNKDNLNSSSSNLAMPKNKKDGSSLKTKSKSSQPKKINKFSYSMPKNINLAQIGHALKFGFKWLAITATIFFFVGGPIIAAWMSDRDSKQQKQQQEDYNKQYEEAVKKAQEEAANKPKEYDESLKYSDAMDSLQIVDEKTGDGTEVKAGDTVKVKYKGALASSGEVFDQNDQGIDLSLGSVIAGWQEGIPGMKVGGTRVLRIPSDKAYGSQANASIPANSNLVFRVELLEVNPPTDQAQ